jgi:hypothetical protein
MLALHGGKELTASEPALQKEDAKTLLETMPFSTVLDVAPADDAPFLEPLPGTSMLPPPPLAYSQLHELVASIGRALMAAGVPRGTRVACAVPNTPALAALIPTLPSSGFALAPLNPELPLEEMVWELSDLPAAALIVPAAKLPEASRRTKVLGVLRFEPDVRALLRVPVAIFVASRFGI